MNDSSPIQLLPLADDTSAAADSSSGCGCGGCGCGESGATPSASTDSTAAAQDRPGQGGDVTGEHAYSVLGMTCGHCARAVTAELGALEGVTDVQVDLVAGGASTVRVTSRRPLSADAVAAALAEAGEYRLA
ncbi:MULTISPECIES: cation transporter [unclassified Nocardioides]|uniref:heavy-metal-associated domain-containing protein n=1 Tax=unclassified Nocardioides TaxID=2615069 RepID=UPI00005701D2|nr:MULTISPECIES: cation transporter [unclassified Nocardioides]